MSGDDGRLAEASLASSEGAVVAPFASARVREATPVGRLRGAAVAARSAVQKAAAKKKTPARVAHV